MKTVYQGHLSLRDIFVLGILSFMAALSLSATPTGEGQAQSPLLNQSWEVITLLPCQDGNDIEVIFLFSGPYGYEVELLNNGSTLHFSLFSTAETPLPEGQNVAVIKVTNPQSDCLSTFRVSTDGGGILIAMDEF